MKHFPLQNIEMLSNMFFSGGEKIFGLIRAITGKTGLHLISVDLVRCKIHSDCCGILHIKPKSTESTVLHALSVIPSI